MQEIHNEPKYNIGLRFGVCFSIAAVCAGLWMFLSQFTAIWFQKSFTNISAYILFVLIFVAAFVVAELALPELSTVLFQKTLASSKVSFAVALGVCLLIVGSTVLSFYHADYVSGGDAAMEWAWNWRLFVTIALLGLVAAVWMWHRSKHRWKLHHRLIDAFLGVCVVLLLVLAAVWAYTPNNLNFLWDYEAYWFSVLSAVRGMPLSWENSSFYGHYGMLMTPFFNLLGGFTPARAALMLSAEAVVIVAGYCYVLWFVTKNSFLRFLGLCVITDYFATVSTIEGQMTPHRVVFPVIVMAFGAFYVRNLEKRGKTFSVVGMLVGYALAITGMVWSTDSGIAGILGWCALHFYVLLTQKKAWWRHCLSVVKVAACIVLCVILAWQATSVMNMVFWKGETVSFQLFFAPLMPEPAQIQPPVVQERTQTAISESSAQEASVASNSVSAQVESEQGSVDVNAQVQSSQKTEPTNAHHEEKPTVGKNATGKEQMLDADVEKVGGTNGYIDGLQIPLARQWVPWVLVMAMLFVVLGRGLYDTVFNRGRVVFSAQRAFGMLNAALCAVLLVYFFNRAYHYNIFTAFFSIAILLMQLCQMALESQMQSKEKSVAKAIFTGGLSGLLICGIIITGLAAGRSAVQIRKIKGCQRVEAMSTFFNELRARVPEDTRFIGIGNTYYNAALDTPTKVMMMHPWMNTFRVDQKEYLLTQADTPLAITDCVTYDSFERLSGCTIEDLRTKYDGPTEFRLNYVNYEFEESHTIYLFVPKQNA